MTAETKIFEQDQCHYRSLLISGIVLVIAVFVTSLCFGNYKTTITDVFIALINPESSPNTYKIITLSRLPRLLASVLVGAALSVAGLTYQDVFSNRMASPDILGVSAGAGVGASIAIYFEFSFMIIGLLAFAGGGGIRFFDGSII